MLDTSSWFRHDDEQATSGVTSNKNVFAHNATIDTGGGNAARLFSRAELRLRAFRFVLPPASRASPVSFVSVRAQALSLFLELKCHTGRCHLVITLKPIGGIQYDYRKA
jgi:hypothetical protein